MRQHGKLREQFYDWVVSLWMVWLIAGTMAAIGLAALWRTLI